MKVKDLIPVIIDDVFIYALEDGCVDLFDSEYLFDGNIKEAPENVLNKTVLFVNSIHAGIINIRVED